MPPDSPCAPRDWQKKCTCVAEISEYLCAALRRSSNPKVPALTVMGGRVRKMLASIAAPLCRTPRPSLAPSNPSKYEIMRIVSAALARVA
jgi:hypothetical protein